VPDSDAKTEALAGAIVAMGRSLGIRTVAEGIETAEQADRMRALGCAYGQGYYFATPMPGSEVATGAFDSLSGVDRPASTETTSPAETPPHVVFRAPFGGFSRRRILARTETTSA
jgi:predicted signal transduction protein with EAL and GGDEF domain